MRNTAVLGTIGRAVFALSILALGIENWLCAHMSTPAMGPAYAVIPALPFLPAIPWLADLFGGVFAACGLGLFFGSTRRAAAIATGAILFVCTLVLETPKYAPDLGSVSLRTVVFEPLAMACLAWLLPGSAAVPRWLATTARWVLAISLVVFGVDHFLLLRPIAALIPAFIPWHVFWCGFFGAAFVSAGFAIGMRVLERAAAFCLGLMFLLWVVALHLPLALGLETLPGRNLPAGLWSSLFIAMAMWGGLWALVGHPPKEQS